MEAVHSHNVYMSCQRMAIVSSYFKEHEMTEKEVENWRRYF